MTKQRWSRWRAFPDPASGQPITDRYGPGVYELRDTARPPGQERIQFGIGGELAVRMRSLLPARLGGRGTRKNLKKREYVGEHWATIEYRILATETRDDAVVVERSLKAKHIYLFPT